MLDHPTDNTSPNPAVQVAEQRARSATADPVILSTGVRARIRAVSSSLIAEVAMRVPDPDIPRWLNPDKGREEENPNDPEYLRALTQANILRNQAAADAAIMFGVELVEPLPEDGWDFKLRLIGIEVPEDPIGREFAYKKYVAVGVLDMLDIQRAAGVSQMEAASALQAFPGK